MSQSEKLKSLLENKESQCNSKITKLKRRMKIIKIISVSFSVTTILILSILASTLVLNPLVISILSIIGAFLTAVDYRFKFQNKSFEKKQLIEKLIKIQNKLEYINSCNGNLTAEEYQIIFSEFCTVL